MVIAGKKSQIVEKKCSHPKTISNSHTNVIYMYISCSDLRSKTKEILGFSTFEKFKSIVLEAPEELDNFPGRFRKLYTSTLLVPNFMAIGGRKKIWRPKNILPPRVFTLSNHSKKFKKKFCIFQNASTFLSGRIGRSDLESIKV